MGGFLMPKKEVINMMNYHKESLELYAAEVLRQATIRHKGTLERERAKREQMQREEYALLMSSGIIPAYQDAARILKEHAGVIPEVLITRPTGEQDLQISADLLWILDASETEVAYDKISCSKSSRGLEMNTRGPLPIRQQEISEAVLDAVRTRATRVVQPRYALEAKRVASDVIPY